MVLFGAGNTPVDSDVLIGNIVPTQASNGTSGYLAGYTGTNKQLVAVTNITPTSVIAAGIVDGLVPVTATTVTSCTLGTASGCDTNKYSSGFTFNEYATAGTGVVYTLPTAAAGLQYCVGNGYNGSAANTGTLEFLTSSVGQYIIGVAGVPSASGGYVISNGAAGDAACVVGVKVGADSTHYWQLYVQRGTWTLH